MERKLRRNEGWCPECGHLLSENRLDCPFCGWALSDFRLHDSGLDPSWHRYADLNTLSSTYEDVDGLIDTM